MSGSADEEPAVADVTDTAPDEASKQQIPMPLSAFAETLRPRRVQVPNPSRPGQFKTQITPGSPDEIYIKLLKRLHGREKKTEADWKQALNALRSRPAHPSVTKG